MTYTRRVQRAQSVQPPRTLHEGAARLEPLLADAGMPPIINASVVNASPVSQPDIAFFAGREIPARAQNVAASTRERETGNIVNPWIQEEEVTTPALPLRSSVIYYVLQ
jgi:hypothetical protein